MDKKRKSDVGAASPDVGDLAASAEALRNAAKSLQDSTAQIAAQLQQMNGKSASAADHVTEVQASNGNQSPKTTPKAASPDRSAQRYYEQLEQTGQIADVDEHTDLSKLPSRITHIRHPDGTVERIGFS